MGNDLAKHSAVLDFCLTPLQNECSCKASYKINFDLRETELAGKTYFTSMA